MCGGGPKGPSEEDKKKSEERHQENLALQKEQMAEQKRQFEITRADNQRRYKEQKKTAEAAPPPKPEKTAAVAAPAIDSLQIKRSGRQKYVNPPSKKDTRSKKPKTSFNAKNTYMV